MRFHRTPRTMRALSFVLVTALGGIGILYASRHASMLTSMLPSVTWLNRTNYVSALQLVTRPAVDGSTTILPNASPDQPILVVESTSEALQGLNFAALRQKHNGRIKICVLHPYADRELLQWLDDALLVQPATARMGYFADNSLRLRVYPKFFLLAPNSGACVAATAGIDSDDQLQKFVANAISSLPVDAR